MNNKPKKILIIIAHSDDETIGMGGTIKRHATAGDEINVVSMTNGVASREHSNQIDAIKRQKSARQASKLLGFSWLKQFDFPDNQLDSLPLIKIVKTIESVKDIFQPELVYTHCGADLNIDHQIVLQAVLTAFRPRYKEQCTEIRLFEVPSATDYGHENVTGKFSPNLFIDISKFNNDKISALNSYKQEMLEYPNSRSIEGIMNLAKVRGSQVGLKSAEAFQIIRKIET